MDLDRLKASIARVLRALTRRLDYAALYPATVVSQNDDGSLELQPPAGSPLPGLSRVSIFYGVPGITAKVKSGGEVLVGFLDPSSPYALVHDQASVASIALLGGTQAVVRVGDGCQVWLPPGGIFSGTVTTPSGPAPLVGPAAMANPLLGTFQSGQDGALA